MNFTSGSLLVCNIRTVTSCLGFIFTTGLFLTSLFNALLSSLCCYEIRSIVKMVGRLVLLLSKCYRRCYSDVAAGVILQTNQEVRA